MKVFVLYPTIRAAGEQIFGCLNNHFGNNLISWETFTTTTEVGATEVTRKHPSIDSRPNDGFKQHREPQHHSPRSCNSRTLDSQRNISNRVNVCLEGGSEISRWYPLQGSSLGCGKLLLLVLGVFYFMLRWGDRPWAECLRFFFFSPKQGR